MREYVAKVIQTADYLRGRCPARPEIGLLTGTGLGEIVGLLDRRLVVDYAEIPHFPEATVPSHAGSLVFGTLARRTMAVMQGRFHLYEGYSPLEVTFPIRVMQELGVRTLVVTNAAGGLNPLFQAGDIMLIRDHINLTGANPLRGTNEDAWGLRFPDMGRAYDPRLLELAEDIGITQGFIIWKGVYAGLLGPSLETPSEIRFLRTIGAEAVGFSTIQEVIAAVHAGMRVLGVSTITNVPDPDEPQPATVDEIIAVAREAAPKVGLIIQAVAEAMDD